MFILVKPTATTKGIVIFNHKEVLRNKNFEKIESIRERWYIGFNNGGWLGQYENNIRRVDKMIDFYISPYPICNLSKNLPFCGSSFIKEDFKLLKNDKKMFNEIRDNDIRDYCINFYINNKDNRFIDIIVLSRNVGGKNVDEFVKFLFDKKDKLNLNVLMYCYTPGGVNSKMQKMIDQLNKTNGILIKFYKDYLKETVMTEREVIILLNNSKYSYNNNKAEGNCRMIQESMLCGCVPIVNRSMLGGLKNHYLNWNTIDINEIKKILDNNENISERINIYNTKKIAEYAKENFNEEKTIHKFTECLNKYFDTKFIFFDLENLAKKLPSHRAQEITKHYFKEKATSYEFLNSDLILDILKKI